MLNDLQIALQCQAQYEGKIPLRTIADTDFSIVHNEGVVDLIFQGTANLEDAKRDLETGMVESGFGCVHAGSYSGLREVFIAIKDELPIDKLIRISGHSLGAMEAAEFACILYLGGYRNLEVITFAMPRFGDADAIKYFNQIKNRTYRNYYDFFEHDFFTSIPLWLPTLPFQPAPNCIDFWSPPTLNNEWRDFPYNIQCHSLLDCYIAGLQKI